MAKWTTASLISNGRLRELSSKCAACVGHANLTGVLIGGVTDHGGIAGLYVSNLQTGVSEVSCQLSRSEDGFSLSIVSEKGDLEQLKRLLTEEKFEYVP